MAATDQRLEEYLVTQGTFLLQLPFEKGKRIENVQQGLFGFPSEVCARTQTRHLYVHTDGIWGWKTQRFGNGEEGRSRGRRRRGASK